MCRQGQPQLLPKTWGRRGRDLRVAGRAPGVPNLGAGWVLVGCRVTTLGSQALEGQTIPCVVVHNLIVRLDEGVVNNLHVRVHHCDPRQLQAVCGVGLQARGHCSDVPMARLPPWAPGQTTQPSAHDPGCPWFLSPAAEVLAPGQRAFWGLSRGQSRCEPGACLKICICARNLHST